MIFGRTSIRYYGLNTKSETVPSITMARISTEDLDSLYIILTELSSSKKMKAKIQNSCTVLYFKFHFGIDE